MTEEQQSDDIYYHERGAGVYPAVFVKIENFEYTDKVTDETVPRWRWVFQDVDDDTTAGEMDTLTSRSFKPRTNALKFLTGIKGSPPLERERPSALYGTMVNVVWGPNTAGKLTITDVLPMKPSKK